MLLVNDILKRLFDIIFGFLGLLLSLPIFIVISCAIKLESKGKVFFKQGRLGLNGCEFKIYKFRSMVENAEKIGTGLFNFKDDPRVTKVGNFLRKTSLDEIPQFINIIKGDMSFVGPRPPVTYELGRYEDFDEELKKRFKMKPGVTGLAQVNGRNEISWDDKIKFDLKYIEGYRKYGILLDFVILFKTIIKVIRMEGSYENEDNAMKDKARQK